MKNVVVLLWVWLYLIVRFTYTAISWVWREFHSDMKLYAGGISILQVAVALTMGVAGIGILCVILAAMRV